MLITPYIKWIHWKQLSHNIYHKIESRVWNYPSGTSCHINLGRKHFSKFTFSQVGSIFIVIKRHSNHSTLNGSKMTVHIWGGALNLKKTEMNLLCNQVRLQYISFLFHQTTKKVGFYWNVLKVVELYVYLWLSSFVVVIYI